ncbi:hypothetical protein GGR30_002465 [Martelella radicis]|uniref:DUF1674 domain-containing protein n=1 Tax=Martelella radicis TaxID=1397476 RepID=A0A7W6KJV2_9HYPH|nr:hypothetical protein [Martelella radicis]
MTNDNEKHRAPENAPPEGRTDGLPSAEELAALTAGSQLPAGDPEEERRANLPEAARRALAEAEARRKAAAAERPAKELGGRGGLDPARYGDWEIKGRAIDF